MPGDWTPTRPRGPIAAHFASPGPSYALPSLTGKLTHDYRSTKPIAPSYSFGSRRGKFVDDCSPGPAYFPLTDTTRNGKDGTPKYSLYGRPRTATLFNNPGPGEYQPERSCRTSVSPNAAAYSFGLRTRSRSCDNTPAPNNYTMPGMVGKTVMSSKKQAPSYSLSGRMNIGSFTEDMQKAPGPGTYNIVDPSRYKNKNPSYSMTSRNVIPGDATRKPGPGAYRPEKVWLHKNQNPQFSFGIRHTEYLAPLIVTAQEA